jgi:hypothetical protein
MIGAAVDDPSRHFATIITALQKGQHFEGD